MSLDFIDTAIGQFDREGIKFRPYEISAAIYSMAHDIMLTQEQQRTVAIEVAPWEFHSRKDHQSCWGTYYAPLSEGTLDDGTRVVNPDIRTLGPHALAVWASRLWKVTHPVMVARYADVLWDLAHIIDPTVKRDYRFGQIAVDAYIRLVREEQSTSDIESAQELQRALQIATELNDAERIDAVSGTLLDLAASATLSSIGVWIMPARAFDGKRKIAESRRKQLIAELERRMDEAAQACNGYAANAAGEALLKVYKRDSRPDDRHRVIRIVADAYLRQSEKADASVAIAWLTPVARLLETEGLDTDAERIRLVIEKRGPEALAAMKTHFVEIPINLKEVDESLEEIVSVQHPFLALLRLVRNLIPKCESLRKQVKQHEKEFVFYSLFSRTIIGHDGLPKASIGSSEHDPEGRMVEEATAGFRLTPEFFSRGYQKTKEKFDFTIHDLVEIFAASSLVRQEMIKPLEEGVSAYDSGDYLKVISVLIPLVESMLRELLKLLEIPVTKGVRGVNGGTELKNMNDVLSDARVEDALEEDLLFFLRILYIDKRAYNLRNEVAHGVLPAAGFNRATASLVMMSLVLLAVIGPQGVYLSQEGDPQDQADQVG